MYCTHDFSGVIPTFETGLTAPSHILSPPPIVLYLLPIAFSPIAYIHHHHQATQQNGFVPSAISPRRPHFSPPPPLRSHPPNPTNGSIQSPRTNTPTKRQTTHTITFHNRTNRNTRVIQQYTCYRIAIRSGETVDTSFRDCVGEWRY